MKGAFGLLLMALVVLLMRSTVLSPLALGGLILDALAFATVVWALRHGDAWGCTFGFVIGLAADLDAAHWIGRHALVLTLIGYAVGRLSGTLVRESARTQVVLLALAVGTHQAWISAFEMGAAALGLPFLLARVGLAVVATAPLGALLLMVLRRITGQPLFGHASRPASSA